MAVVYSAKLVNTAASHHATVKVYMDYLTFQMLAHADAALVAHRHDGRARVFRVYTKVDWYIVLEDTDPKGNLGALSIEYGHGEYVRRVRRKDGEVIEVTVPASEPTYILTNATKIRKKSRPVRVPGTFSKKVYRRQTGTGELKGRL